MTPGTATTLKQPKRPDGIQTKVLSDFSRQYVSVNGYSVAQQNILSATIDDIEIEVDLKTYDTMENDSTIAKAKKIIITNALADDLQLAPGATEEQVGAEEYDIYVKIMEFCERVVSGLDQPIRKTYEQILGNALAHGHGIGETDWEMRLDAFSSKPTEDKTPNIPVKKTALSSLVSGFGLFSKANTPQTVPDAGIKRPQLRGEAMRIMPRSVKIKPTGVALFVVDDYMNVLGLIPRWRSSRTTLGWDEIIDRDKFVVLTLNQQNEDPRGKSSYRPAFNWFNLKSQIPAEMLRFILEESVPKAVGTMPENAPPFEYERDQAGNIVYEDPTTMQIPKMLTAAESMGAQIKGFRSGSGAVIPFGAKLEPFKKTGASDADFFNKVIKVVDDQMEYAILLQTLAQSEGEHQARSASQQVAELLHNLIFWIRWLLAVMTMRDLFEVAVEKNFGPWAIRYLPMVSLGDFVRRDWAHDLEVLSKAYFQGFIDDTQRPELMAWMNLPKPGQSRQEQMQDALAVPDVNGEPAKPNNGRPDKQAANKNRNAGNGTEKQNGKTTNADYGFSPLDFLGHHGRRTVRSTRALLTGRSTR